MEDAGALHHRHTAELCLVGGGQRRIARAGLGSVIEHTLDSDRLGHNGRGGSGGYANFKLLQIKTELYATQLQRLPRAQH